MKKSDMYTLAMEAVLRDTTLAVSEKVDILGVLMVDRSMARWSEKAESEKEAAE
jgi:hypothetical protein